MRFAKTPRYGDFEPTARKRAAAERRQKRERDQLPLFAAQIAAQQPTVDDVMVDRAASWTRAIADHRRQIAGDWRRARAGYFALPKADRRLARDAIATWWGDVRPSAVFYIVGLARRGELLGVLAKREEAIERGRNWRRLLGVAT